MGIASDGKVKTLTIRQRMQAIQASMLDGNMTPAMVRDVLMELSGLSGSIADEQRRADTEYAFVLAQQFHESQSAAGARIIAETTAAFWRAREAKDVAHQVEQMALNCRHYLQSLNEELRLAR